MSVFGVFCIESLEQLNAKCLDSKELFAKDSKNIINDNILNINEFINDLLQQYQKTMDTATYICFKIALTHLKNEIFEKYFA